jgi:Spy/CpxP family protein refolding chaperone
MPHEEKDMSKYIKLFMVSIGLSFALGFGFLAAQERQAGANQERIRRNIHTLRLLQMTQALDLSENQTAAIFPVMNRLENKKADLQREVAAAVRELRALIREGKATEEALQGAADRVTSLRRAILAKDGELEAFLDGQLTPLQRAKYVLFSIDFYQGLGQGLRRARGPLR